MRAIKKAEKIIEKDISKPFAKLLSQLIVSLETDEPFQLRLLYEDRKSTRLNSSH